MSPGFDRPLYILPFDHRPSLAEMFRWREPMNIAELTVIEVAKQIAYEGFKAAIAAGVPRDKGAIAIDELFGARIMRQAAEEGYMFACPAEKSGQSEFEFQYGENFAAHIEEFRPTFCKVSVNYNPEGDGAANRRQAERLKKLSDYLRENSSTRFMFELMVSPEKAHLEKTHGDRSAYEKEVRPGLTVRAIHELQDAQVEPDVWNVEGFECKEDFQKIVTAARCGGRGKVGCVVIGRGQGEDTIRKWLTLASEVPGFIGFAVGRTDFQQPLAIWRAKEGTREAATETIARRYRELVDIFEKARLK